MARWASSAINAYQVDQLAPVFEQRIGVLQQEQDSLVNRLQRLMPDDKYAGADTASRPQATTSTKPKEGSTSNDALYEAFTEKNHRAGRSYDKNDTALLFIESEHKSVNSAIT
jgi:hypothetical protein